MIDDDNDGWDNSKWIHSINECRGFCPFHNPSDHHMVKWPRNVRASALTERICPHGIGHPDPDSYEWLEKTFPQGGAWGIHGCDGCCHLDPAERRGAKPK
jgi:hypothetical protein